MLDGVIRLLTLLWLTLELEPSTEIPQQKPPLYRPTPRSVLTVLKLAAWRKLDVCTRLAPLPLLADREKPTLTALKTKERWTK